MRRRTKHAPNTSESTGKIGQELPANQPQPLVPSYGDDLPLKLPANVPLNVPLTRASARTQAEHLPARGVSPATPPARHHATPVPTRNAPRVASSAAPDPDAEDWDIDEPTGRRLEMELQPDSPSMPPPELEAALRAPEAPKGFVVLTIGLPGSGKTTWFKRRGVTPLSSDLLRTLLFDDITEQRYQGLVFSTLRSLLRARLIARMPWNYVDATNLSPHERRQWIKMAKSFGYEVQAVFFDVPLEVCLERNRKRERKVAEEVMLKMSERLKPPVFEEGFAKITVVRVKRSS